MRRYVAWILRLLVTLVILIASQLVWRFYYLAFIPGITGSRVRAGVPPNAVAGHLLDFVVTWQNRYHFWTGIGLALCIVVTVLSFGRSVSSQTWARRLVVSYFALVMCGSAALVAANLILAAGLK